MTKKKTKRSTIYLMRHGQAAPPGLMVGRNDYQLRPEGRAEMAAWAEFFAPIPVSAVWTSPLLRARDSAKIITRQLNRPPSGQNFHIEPGFTEISLGDWDGMDKNDVQLKYPAAWEARGRDFMNYAPPGGESFNSLSRRVLCTFNSLYEQIIRHDHVLIMAHQAVNRAILAALGQPFRETWLDIPQDYAALNELELLQKRTGILTYNIIKVNSRPPLWLR